MRNEYRDEQVLVGRRNAPVDGRATALNVLFPLFLPGINAGAIKA
jgi:hypothetical protein